jgi:CHRD domain
VAEARFVRRSGTVSGPVAGLCGRGVFAKQLWRPIDRLRRSSTRFYSRQRQYPANNQQGLYFYLLQIEFLRFAECVTQAHIHFAPRPANGGIIVFLCDNTGKAPRGVPACPNSGSVEGTLTAAVVNPANEPEPVTAQGIAAGDFAGLLGAIEHDDAYCNVHTKNFPAGEIRGWLR